MLNACPRIAAFVAVLVIGITPLRLDSQEASYELSGRVREVCGAWLPGTRIELINDAGVTLETRVQDSAGYRFSQIPGPGPWRLTTELLGFQPLTIDRVTLTPGAPNTLNLRLLWKTNIVPGIVGTVTATGVPVAGAAVALRHASKGFVERCETDEEGRYAFVPNDTGPWRLTVSSPGRTPYTINSLRLEPRKQLTFDVQLRGSGQK